MAHKDRRRLRDFRGPLPASMMEKLPFPIQVKARLLEGKEKIEQRIPRTLKGCVQLLYAGQIREWRLQMEAQRGNGGS